MPTSHREVRRYLVEELRKDLVGPDTPDEELTDSPTTHYLAGILYPRDIEVDRDQDEDANEAAEDDDDVDAGTLMAMTTNPSSIGMTFVVKKGELFQIVVKAAVYVPRPDSTRPRSQIWQRRQLDIKPVMFTQLEPKKDLAPGLILRIRSRQRSDQDIVTVSLLNVHTVNRNEQQPDASCFFQPDIAVSSLVEGRAIFPARSVRTIEVQDEDRQQNGLLYRHAVEFAVGHGCAVEWEASEYCDATRISTVIVPAYEVRQLSPDLNTPLTCTGMKFLAEADPSSLTDALQEFLALYRDWISGQISRVSDLPEEYRATALLNIERCNEVADRIAKGVELIASDGQVRSAFQMANRAMLIQRARTEWLRQPYDSRPSQPLESDSARWRAFQLAFILLSLQSIADPGDLTRSVVDLLWFPTGGGKTEAYLGLTAFTIFLRRMRAQAATNGSGVTVLMRYTLRLLTIQQFQRAALLIMACESMRRECPGDLGTAPISLGLWVGGAATPNSLKDAGKALKELLEGNQVFEGNPYQVRSCPWCGAPLKPQHYRINSTMTILCPGKDCEFKTGLPVYLVDEDIYTVKPSLVIGTVDKFARLPWKAETAALFGLPGRTNLPPELIIQDELHLISGPLGTLVGLYETAVDALCQWNGVPPKIIASTATIRRAREQCLGLFARDLSQFPPSGLDARDSFFAKEASPEDRPSRLYVGVYAPGKSMKTTLLRSYALLLQKIAGHQSDSTWRDPYWTLVGYFNSLRELGGAVRLVDDDVRARVHVLAKRDGVTDREIRNTRELNSRIYSDEVPEILDLMGKPLGDESALDVLLATNMISVGVDVDRLGLMVVNGQPKMSSEYIQATSRIGRKYPGLVVTMYNWTRPRDRSHYERFASYHSALYAYVEPTSVTPFAGRARDRGLHATFIAMMRHLSARLNPEDAASDFDPDSSLTEKAISTILERVGRVDLGEAKDTEQQIKQIVNRWVIMSEPGLTYGRQDLPHLMVPAENCQPGSEEFPSLNSLRGVEGECGLFFVGDTTQQRP